MICMSIEVYDMYEYCDIRYLCMCTAIYDIYEYSDIYVWVAIHMYGWRFMICMSGDI